MSKKLQFIMAVKSAGCSYCEAAKKFLAREGYEFSALDVANKDDYEVIHDLFQEAREPVMRSVPMIFVRNDQGKLDLVGGFDELSENWDDIVLVDQEVFTNPKA